MRAKQKKEGPTFVHAKSSVRLFVGGAPGVACCAHTAPSNTSTNTRIPLFRFFHASFISREKAPVAAAGWPRAEPRRAA